MTSHAVRAGCASCVLTMIPPLLVELPRTATVCSGRQPTMTSLPCSEAASADVPSAFWRMS